MITFCLAVALLVGGYFLYGAFVERVFGASKSSPTPAYTLTDGVDYVPMSWGRVFLIQLLNIAGLGPIFGAVMGAMYGPVAFLWIVLGSIFGGAVHDYFSGMMSLRSGGASLPELGGKYMGAAFKQAMRVFTVLLMVLVGVVFMTMVVIAYILVAPRRLSAGLPPKPRRGSGGNAGAGRLVLEKAAVRLWWQQI
jgi:carbon starvation protein CstA